MRDQQGARAAARGGERGLGAGVAAADNDDLEWFGVLHHGFASLREPRILPKFMKKVRIQLSRCALPLVERDRMIAEPRGDGLGMPAGGAASAGEPKPLFEEARLLGKVL